MASIVSCPSCQKRLKIGTDKPGGKLRCPRCNTPFVLGSRINSGSGGPAEFQAFELFEEDIVTDTFTIEEDKPSLPNSALKSLPKSATGARTGPPGSKIAPRPIPPSAPPAARVGALLPDDLDLLGEGPLKSKLPVPPATPETLAPEAILPENFGLADESAGLWPDASKRSALKRDLPPAPKPEEPKPIPKPSPVPAASTDFFLPTDFDPFAIAPAKPATSNLSLDDDIPALRDEEPDFEVVEETIRLANDGVPIIEAATNQEIAEAEARMQDFEEVRDEPRDRRVRREHRRRRARTHRIGSDVRTRWLIVHWSLAIQLIGLVLFVAAAALGMLSFLLYLSHAQALVGLCGILILGLLLLREAAVLLSYALGIPAPTKNKAWLWAVLAIFFGFPSIAGYFIAIISPMITISIGMTTVLMGWFCYILYLRAVGEALKINYIVDECHELMKTLGLTLMGGIGWNVFTVLYIVIVHPGNSLADALGSAVILLTCGIVFLVFLLIMGAINVVKFYFIVMNLRQEIGWRLE